MDECQSPSLSERDHNKPDSLEHSSGVICLMYVGIFSGLSVISPPAFVEWMLFSWFVAPSSRTPRPHTPPPPRTVPHRCIIRGSSSLYRRFLPSHRTLQQDKLCQLNECISTAGAKHCHTARAWLYLRAHNYSSCAVVISAVCCKVQGTLACLFCCLCATDFSDSPLVRHLLTE